MIDLTDISVFRVSFDLKVSKSPCIVTSVEYHNYKFHFFLIFSSRPSESSWNAFLGFAIFLVKFPTFFTFSISDEIIIEIYYQIFNFHLFWSDWIRSVQNGSNLIKFLFWWNQIARKWQFFITFSTESNHKGGRGGGRKPQILIT